MSIHLRTSHQLPKTHHPQHDAQQAGQAGQRNPAHTGKTTGKQGDSKDANRTQGGEGRRGAAADAARDLPIQGRGSKDGGAGQGGGGGDSSNNSSTGTGKAGKAGAAGAVKPTRRIHRSTSPGPISNRRNENVSHEVAGTSVMNTPGARLTDAHARAFSDMGMDKRNLAMPPSAALSGRSIIKSSPFGKSLAHTLAQTHAGVKTIFTKAQATFHSFVSGQLTQTPQQKKLLAEQMQELQKKKHMMNQDLRKSAAQANMKEQAQAEQAMQGQKFKEAVVDRGVEGKQALKDAHKTHTVRAAQGLSTHTPGPNQDFKIHEAVMPHAATAA